MARLHARERKQLLHQARGTLQAATQSLARLSTFRFGLCDIECPELQIERGERRSQFVGRIGNERAITFEDARQTDSTDSFSASTNGRTSAGRPSTGKGSSAVGARVRTVCARRSSGSSERRTTTATIAARTGSSNAKGRSVRSAEAGGLLLADTHRLRHLDHTTARTNPEHAPIAFACADGRNAERRQSRDD